MKEMLISEIDRREAELQHLESRKGVLEIELTLLRRLLAQAEQTENAPSVRQPYESGARVHFSAEPKRRTSGTNMSERWKCVVRAAVERSPTPVRNDEVPEIQRAVGQIPADQQNVRSHVSTFKSAGLYEKVGVGMFRATEKAAELIGLPLGRHSIESAVTADGYQDDSSLFGASKEALAAE